MFNKKDPLIDSVKKVMQENQIRREVEQALNEQLGIQTRKQLPFQKHAEYDAMLAEAIQEALSPKQQKLAAFGKKVNPNDNPNTIGTSDLKAARMGHAKHIEEEQLDESKVPDSHKKAMIKSYGPGRVSVDTKNGMIRHKDKNGEINSHTYDPNKKQPIGRHVGTISVNEEEQLDERKINPYAIGMAAVKKSTGDEPPMEKKNITKAHEIAKKIIKKKMNEASVMLGRPGMTPTPPAPAGTNAAKETNATAPSTPSPTASYGGSQMGGTPSAVKTQTTQAVGKPLEINKLPDTGQGAAQTAARMKAISNPTDKASSGASTAPSAPRSSEVVASKAAGVPDSRNLRTPVKAASGEGATGKALASLGVSRADRLNPNFLKSQGITAKAGSAEANLALKSKMGAQKAAVTAAENPKSAANAPNALAKNARGGSAR